MARQIDADALKKAIMAEPWKNEPNMVRLTVDYINIIIDEQPTVDAVPVVHGKAVPIRADIDYEDTLIRMDRQCNRCGALITQMDNYCPNCGAHMDLEVG